MNPDCLQFSRKEPYQRSLSHVLKPNGKKVKLCSRTFQTLQNLRLLDRTALLADFLEISLSEAAALSKEFEPQKEE